ncbi:MAG: hypothetical protein KKC84_03180 [Candidatus Omnitrophica bacterium]|nr:hypothetical protein [Candidatus Omnitrophota bacterium]
MKNLPNTLIGVATLSLIVGLISRLTVKPIMGLESRAMVGFAAVLLLLSIALSVKK